MSSQHDTQTAEFQPASDQTPYGIAPDAKPYTYSYYDFENVYSALCPANYAKRDRMAVLIHLHDQLHKLPDTAETITKRLLADGRFQGQVVSPDHIHVLGIWNLPEHMVGSSNGNRGKRMANPLNEDSWRYSDVYSECECGAIVTSMHTAVLGEQCDHADDCHRIDQWRAKAELWENRREAMIEQFYYGHDTNTAAERLGYSKGCIHRQNAHDHKVDHHKLIAEAKDRIVKTCAMNLHIHSPGEMGPLFGWSADRLTQAMHDLDLDPSVSEMYSIRRETGTAHLDALDDDYPYYNP